MATGYNRVYNTVLSGNEAQSSLSGNDVRMLEFDAALKRRPAVVLSSANNELSVEDWMQASIDTLLLDPNGAANEVSLGADVASQAAAYVQLFDLRSTGDQRLLRMSISTPILATGIIQLKNTSASALNVKVALSGAVAAGGAVNLFNQNIGAGGVSAGALPGLERLVVVSATNLNSGFEAVQFNVLSGSL